MKNLDSERLVFDNAVLSNFARIKKLDLLLKLPCELITTREVIAEVRNGIKAFSIKNIEKSQNFKVIIKLVNDNKIKVISIVDQESLSLYSKLEKIGLGYGEISTMVLAKELRAIFVTDEKRAINIAKKLGVTVIDRYEFRATVVILKFILSQRIITVDEFRKIKADLKRENFLF